MISNLIKAVEISGVQLISVVGGIIVAGFILGFIGRETQKLLMRSGGKSLYLATAMIGTPVHEIGHAVFCILFNHKIQKIKLFDRHCTNGNLGYVQHGYNTLSLYQRIGNFFIAVGPLFSGSVVMLILMYLLLPDTFSTLESNIVQILTQSNNLADIFQSTGLTFKNMVSTLRGQSLVKMLVFGLLSMCVSSHMTLSNADMKGALSGLFTMFILLVVSNIGLFGSTGLLSTILKVIVSVNYFTLFVLSISICLSLLSCILAKVIELLTGR